VLRTRIREQFERNRHITDPRVIDVLLIKSHQDWQETINCWKMESHMLQMVMDDYNRPPRTFLEKFFEGAANFIF
jgi:NADH dehydrogenase (ubiquinone) 1 alpha subcomplex subunit 6